MDQFNLFEPDLELGRSLIPYGDMEIQGVWPRKQRTPSDVFPTSAALIGRGPNNDARWCATDKDGILLTNSVGGGGGDGPSPVIVSTQVSSRSIIHGGETFSGEFQGGKYLYGYSISYTVIDPGGSPVDGSVCGVVLSPTVSGNNITLAGFLPQASPASGYMNFYPINLNMNFPWPIDCRDDTGNSQLWDVTVGNPFFNATCSIILYFSNP